jgi:AraC-like DNA-binding protein
MMQIQWLMEPDSAPDPIDEGRRALPMPDHLGEGWLETLEMPLDMRINDLTYQFVAERSGEWIETATMQALLDEPHLVINGIPQGRGLMHDRRDNQVHGYGAGKVLLGFSAEVDAAYRAEAGPSLQGVWIEMAESRLHRLMGDAATDFLNTFDLSDGRMRSLHMPLIERRLRACLAPGLQGSMRKLLMQTEVLRLLFDLASLGLHAEESEPRLVKVLRLIREEVDHAPESPPDLDDLARRYGYSARTLNEGFKKCFDSTLIAYCSEQRLNAAYEAILRSDLALKVLAGRLGYSHVNNFTAAFKKQFGVTPGSLRRAPTEPSWSDE